MKLPSRGSPLHADTLLLHPLLIKYLHKRERGLHIALNFTAPTPSVHLARTPPPIPRGIVLGRTLDASENVLPPPPSPCRICDTLEM